MRALGISRVIDITRGDRLGLPVFLSMRPGGATLRVHAGKGVSAIDARVGALMEAVEFAVGEHASRAGADTCLPLGELAAQLPAGLTLYDFAPRLGISAAPDRTTPAVRCEDLISRRKVLIPAELVMLPGPVDPAPALFGWSTNGLASGNTLAEATLHALLEVLERDTIAMNVARNEAAPIDNDQLPQPFRQWAAQWQLLGVRLFVRFLPGEFGLPCFEATLHEAGSQNIELARGWGLHLDRTIALSRAISEAAQSRLSKIHSDGPELADLYRHHPHREVLPQGDTRERMLAALNDRAKRIDFQEVPHDACRSIGTALRNLLARLQAQNFHHVFRRRMRTGADGPDLLGLHVVKVVVPRCETVLGTMPRMGPRLLARVVG